MPRKIWIGAGKREDVVGEMAGRCPNLLTVEDPLVAVEFAAQTNVRQVGASIGLAVALTPHVGVRQDARQVVRLLLLGAPLQQRVAQHLNTEHVVVSAGRHASASELFGRDDLLERRQSPAAVFGRPTWGQIAILVQHNTPMRHELMELVAFEFADTTPIAG